MGPTASTKSTARLSESRMKFLTAAQIKGPKTRPRSRTAPDHVAVIRVAC